MQRESSLSLIDITVENIHPQQNNPNVMQEPEFERLKQEILDVGVISPIIVIPKLDQDGHYTIVNGEHRWKACREIGQTFIPCVVLYDNRFQDQEFLELLNIRLNNLHGSLDHLKLLPIYQKNVEKYGAEEVQSMMGLANKTIWKKTRRVLDGYLAKAGVAESERAQILDNVDAGQAESVSKKITRALKAKNPLGDLHSVLFMHSGKESLAISIPQDVFRLLKTLHVSCQSDDQAIGDVLRPHILAAVKSVAPDAS
ncbi:MAG: ParB N-terminal domain-containing protein [Bacteroidetes bacterium]|nr:ParB N-terminal domain-containing protein [Bacteroidota bacterium]